MSASGSRSSDLFAPCERWEPWEESRHLNTEPCCVNCRLNYLDRACRDFTERFRAACRADGYKPPEPLPPCGS